MRSFKRIIAVILVFVTTFCLFSFSAQATLHGDFVSQSDFYVWLAGQADWLKDLIDWGDNFASDDAICPESDDLRHHSSSGGNEFTGLDGNVHIQCWCDYCGSRYYVEVSQAEYFELLKEAYGTPSTDTSEGSGYVKKVQDELGTTVIGSSGLQISLPCTSFSESSFHSYIRSLEDTSLGYPFDLYFEVTGSDSYSLKITFDSSFVAPISGFYTRFIEIYSSCHSEFGEGLNESYRYGEDYTLDKYSNYMVAVGPTNYTVKGVKVFTGTGGYSDCSITIKLPKGRLSHHFYGRAYYIVEPDNFNLNNYTASIGGVSSRPTSFTGDIGIIGDNGHLTKVEGNQIFNETTNNYYNPSTGTTSTVTDWFYDYSDRSYHLTMESGDTVTVTYGDENITVQEGDTTYNVYYIIEGSASTDSCPEGGAHDWQAGETVDATCTVTGFKTETCSKCGEERTTELPALGHKWKVKQSIQTKYDENGELLQQGYTIYECERCGEQYKSTDGAGPPGGMTPGSGPGSGTGSDSGSGEDDESIWSKLGKFLGTLGDGFLDFVLALIGKILDWLISLAEFLGDKLVAVTKVILDIFDFLPGLFTGFLTFLESAFGFLPTEIVMLLTFGIAAIVFIGIIKAIRR